MVVCTYKKYLFDCPMLYLMSECSEWVRYQVECLKRYFMYIYTCPCIILYLLLYWIINIQFVDYMSAKNKKFTPGFPWNQAFWNHNLTEHCSYFQNWSNLRLVSTQSYVLFHRWFLLAWYLMTHQCAMGGDEGLFLWYLHLTDHCYYFPSCTPCYHLNREMANELSWVKAENLTSCKGEIALLSPRIKMITHTVFSLWLLIFVTSGFSVLHV